MKILKHTYRDGGEVLNIVDAESEIYDALPKDQTIEYIAAILAILLDKRFITVKDLNDMIWKHNRDTWYTEIHPFIDKKIKEKR